MKTFFFTTLLVVAASIPVFAQTTPKPKPKSDIVTVEIVETDNSVKKVDFEWPFPKGPAPLGGSGDGDENVVKKVEKICKDNGIDCPPARKKVSENVWLCSNGKKIRTNSLKLATLLAKAWENN